MATEKRRIHFTAKQTAILLNLVTKELLDMMKSEFDETQKLTETAELHEIRAALTAEEPAPKATGKPKAA